MASDNIVNAHLQQRRGTAAQWTQLNPVLGEGEIGYVTDAKIIKIGDGITAWNSLTAFKAVNAGNADTLGGIAPSGYLAVNGKAADADKLDGYDSATAATPNTIALRDANGRVSTATPVNPTDAVNKQYTDGFVAPPTTVQVFTTTGVFVKPAGLVAAEVICFGGGGGGTVIGGGAGGGGRCRAVIPASALPSSVPVTVGGGGAGGNSTVGNGLAGGTTSFGTFIGATGGAGAVYNSNNSTVQGGYPVGGSVTHEDAGGSGGNIYQGIQGGNVVFAGGGGGAGSSATSGNGGSSGLLSGPSYAVGGGSGYAGASRSGSGLGGSGGGGGGGIITGGAGGIPAGGGGSTGSGGTTGFTGGVGGRGEVVVISYF